MKKVKKSPKQVTPENWSRFRRWRRSRPFAGSILILLASFLVLYGPIALFNLVSVPGNALWAALLVGALLGLMGLFALLIPMYAPMAGGIGVVLSLISLLVGAGGFFIGMILGLIGGAMCVAWKPTVYTLRSDASVTVSPDTSLAIIPTNTSVAVSPDASTAIIPSETSLTIDPDASTVIIPSETSPTIDPDASLSITPTDTSTSSK